jgi:hypothetical protein
MESNIYRQKIDRLIDSNNLIQKFIFLHKLAECSLKSTFISPEAKANISLIISKFPLPLETPGNYTPDQLEVIDDDSDYFKSNDIDYYNINKYLRKIGILYDEKSGDSSESEIAILNLRENILLLDNDIKGSDFRGNFSFNTLLNVGVDPYSPIYRKESTELEKIYEAIQIIKLSIDLKSLDTENQINEKGLKDEFAEGEYVYQLRRSLSEEELKQVPFFIEKRIYGDYLWVDHSEIITRLPLTPFQSKIFEAIPKKIPDIVYIKMALSVLSDVDKFLFIKEIESYTKRLIVDKSNLDFSEVYKIGEYVDHFLSERYLYRSSYFFGSLDLFDIGKLFQDYILENGLTELITKSAGVEAKELMVEIKRLFSN